MIRTRVLVGALLVVAVLALLVADHWLGPWFPCLFACLLFVGAVCAREFVRLCPPAVRPPLPLAVGGTVLVLAANWYPLLRREHLPGLPALASPWEAVLFVFVGVLLVGFLAEMVRYREPGHAVPRLGLTVLIVAYLGLLGSFLAQLRWLGDAHRTGLILALTIFVPKVCDIGAFFTGTFLGRHRMTPHLSPKKTWEGFAGGLVAAALVAVGFDLAGPVFAHGISEAIAFGLALGVAGILGDLAESLVKRDCLAKDAAHSIPGFGGLLDVVDSVLFAAPVAYWWFSFVRG